MVRPEAMALHKTPPVARQKWTNSVVVGRLAELPGTNDVAVEDKYKLCYMRGRGGIIVALAEDIF